MVSAAVKSSGLTDIERSLQTARLYVDGNYTMPPELARVLVDELERLRSLINSPEIHDFASGLWREAVHQRERWGTEHDAGKTPADWFWLVGYLAGKALNAHEHGDLDKAKHRVIATAAALCNWFSAIGGRTNMRPGIAPPEGF